MRLEKGPAAVTRTLLSRTGTMASRLPWTLMSWRTFKLPGWRHINYLTYKRSCFSRKYPRKTTPLRVTMIPYCRFLLSDSRSSLNLMFMCFNAYTALVFCFFVCSVPTIGPLGSSSGHDWSLLSIANSNLIDKITPSLLPSVKYTHRRSNNQLSYHS